MINLKIATIMILISLIALWIAAISQSVRAGVHFVKKYPDEAKKNIPSLGYGFMKHASFLFRKELLPILRQDADLWKLRQQTISLFIAFILWLILSVTILAIWMYLLQR